MGTPTLMFDLMSFLMPTGDRPPGGSRGEKT
jgi:hypothetical protein